jgi:hypothetical protein
MISSLLFIRFVVPTIAVGAAVLIAARALSWNRQRRKKLVANAYRRAYGRNSASEFDGWADEGSWPDP